VVPLTDDGPRVLSMRPHQQHRYVDALAGAVGGGAAQQVAGGDRNLAKYPQSHVTRLEKWSRQACVRSRPLAIPSRAGSACVAGIHLADGDDVAGSGKGEQLSAEAARGGHRNRSVHLGQTDGRGRLPPSGLPRRVVGPRGRRPIVEWNAVIRHEHPTTAYVTRPVIPY
jgi:hypothetical protein